MAKFSDLIRFYRACFQQDSRAVSLMNFSSAKVKDSLIIDNPHLLQGTHIQVPVPSKWGEKAEKAEKDLLLYGKERALYVCAFFLTGETTVIGKKHKVQAPLMLYPAELFREGGVYYVSMNAEQGLLNPSFINVLKKEGSDDQNLYDQLAMHLPKGYIQFDEQHQIEECMKQYFPQLSLNAFEQYPELLSEKEMKAWMKDDLSSFQLTNAVGLGILQKQFSSRGILNELEQMAEQQTVSYPMHQLFMDENFKSKPGKVRMHTPATLSNAQENIFQSVARHPLTMVVGPPGTGKSFSIAALAVDYLSQGKSVLIASKNNQAVDVVADKIEQELNLPGMVVRAGRRDYKKQLQQRIKDLLYGIDVQKIKSAEVRAPRQSFHELDRKLKSLASIMKKRHQEEMQIADFLTGDSPSWWDRWRLYFLRQRLQKELPVWDLQHRYEATLDRRHELVEAYIKLQFQKKLYDTLQFSRKAFQHLLKGITARTGSRKEHYFDGIDFREILGALPIWIVNAADISHALPLQRHLFDLVIIDEASQCDVASCLPLLHRAKRAVIVGDPKQLRHISFLSKDQQRQLVQQFKLTEAEEDILNYREFSVLDIVMNNISEQEQICFLDEHFRSQPEIIAFSNKRFYNNSLRIMTATPQTELQKSVFLHHCDGKRYARGYNKTEAAKLIEHIREKVELEAKLPATICQSIGILSPFREQVNHLQKQVSEAFPADVLKRHRMLVGTPFAFQGEERDLMYLSFAVDAETHPSTFIYLNREDVFNVSITRARSEQHIFWSGRLEGLNPDSLLAHYLGSIKGDLLLGQVDDPRLYRDTFLDEVEATIKTWPVDEVHISYPIAGMEMDLVVVVGEQTMGIDLIGYPGAFEAAFSLERIKILRRMGVSVFPLPYSTWHFRPQACKEALKRWLIRD